MTAEQLEFAFFQVAWAFYLCHANQSACFKNLCGEFDSIASASVGPCWVQACAARLIKPLVSTSANLAGEDPALTAAEILADFTGKIDALVLGELGEQRQPSTIIDAKRQILRNGQ